jgi:hypothetical protein
MSEYTSNWIGEEATDEEVTYWTAGGEAMEMMAVNTEQSLEINELAGALAKAQMEMPHASKDSTNEFFRSGYADLAAVMRAWQSAGPKHGLAVVQTLEPSDGTEVTVVTTLMHSSGQWIAGKLTMKPEKLNPQGIGSCITYARRYSLSAIVGIAQDDDDGNAASGNKKKAFKPEQAKGAEMPEGLPNSKDIAYERYIEWAGEKGNVVAGMELFAATLGLKIKNDKLTHREWVQIEAAIHLHSTGENMKSYKEYIDGLKAAGG